MFNKKVTTTHTHKTTHNPTQAVKLPILSKSITRSKCGTQERKRNSMCYKAALTNKKKRAAKNKRNSCKNNRRAL